MSKESDRRARLRWITLGEAVAIAALIISALGLWLTWKQEPAPAQPAKVIEERKPIPLKLRGHVEDEGRKLIIAPIEESHALDSLVVKVTGEAESINVGSDGVLDASELQSVIGKPKDDVKGEQRLPVTIDTRYVEAGTDRRSTSNYVIRYEWEGGGLFGGRSVRLTGFSRR
jgi:hypothetical protein